MRFFREEGVRQLLKSESQKFRVKEKWEENECAILRLSPKKISRVKINPFPWRKIFLWVTNFLMNFSQHLFLAKSKISANAALYHIGGLKNQVLVEIWPNFVSSRIIW